MNRTIDPRKPSTTLCAIYTRKSTDENLNSDFTSLDSQREYCQSFVKSREGEGWHVYPEEYNDPGFSGGNINRPGLRKLLSDARAGKFQVVVCYKYDRLSRNTKDFLHVLDIFDRHGVAFVSVTQPIDTTSSVGRLMRSILMDFSQFEREMIAERTRDKLHAMAQKGRRTGGCPIIGYDIDDQNHKFKVNTVEAGQVREMFDTYLKTLSMNETAKILNGKGYRMKEWVTHQKKRKGGQKFNKASLWYLLQNPTYVGKITHRKQVLPGEHEAIIPQDLFDAAQKALNANGNGKLSKELKTRTYAFLLRGLVECASCKTTMTPSSALPRYKRKQTQYERFYYYKCLSVVKADKSACAVRHVSAKPLENYVIKRLQLLSQNHEIVDKIVSDAQSLTGHELPIKCDERNRIVAELGKMEHQAKSLVMVLAEEGPQSPMRSFVREKLSEIENKKQEFTTRLNELNLEIEQMEKRQIDANVVRKNLQNFMKLFEKMTETERQEVMGLLVEKVIYDAVNSRVRIALRPLPEVWGNLEQLEGYFSDRKKSDPNDRSLTGQEGFFYDRQTTLPDPYGNRTELVTGKIQRKTNDSEALSIYDVAPFELVTVKKGMHKIVVPEEAKAIKWHQRRFKPPQPPPIQTLLKQAYLLKEQLVTAPQKTRNTLAKETGINPSYLTRILNLLKLAPEIQNYILSLPPGRTKGPITESRLKHIARIPDSRIQLEQFEKVKIRPVRESLAISPVSLPIS